MTDFYFKINLTKPFWLILLFQVKKFKGFVHNQILKLFSNLTHNYQYHHHQKIFQMLKILNFLVNEQISFSDSKVQVKKNKKKKRQLHPVTLL